MKRASGILMHISTLPGDFGIGSFGREAKEFIDFLVASGQSYWQVLPFSHPDDYFSPYKSVSAFAGNPYFIDLETLYKEELITLEELYLARQKTPYACEFDTLKETRIPLLKKAASRFKDKTIISSFLASHPQIANYCSFMSLQEKNHNLPFTEWTDKVIDEDVKFAYAFMQYKFFEQWSKIKAYANEHGVKIIGDIPIYVSYDSADVYFNPNLFELDEDLKPTNVAGVPPDYFSEEGQLWGNPLYKWDVMKQDGYAWWRERITTVLELFDAVRIDHFRGLESYWSVPSTAKTAKSGSWKKGPGKDFIKMLQEVSAGKTIIAEDLGDITPAVNRLIAFSKFPGMRVFQFAFLGDPISTHLPHNYPENAIAYTGTHDNNTLLGYVWEQTEENRKRILDYCQFEGENWDTCYDHLIKTVLGSRAYLAIVPIQDYLHFGSDCRLNTPGRASGNWSFRITKEMYSKLNTSYIRYLSNLYGRC